jgi:hypothetical protein
VTGGSVAPVSPVRVWECADCGRTYVAQGDSCRLCGAATKEVTAGGRGRLTSWTTVHAVPAGERPYVLGWVELDGTGVGVLGRFAGEVPALHRDLPLLVHQSDGPDGWPRLTLQAVAP